MTITSAKRVLINFSTGKVVKNQLIIVFHNFTILLIFLKYINIVYINVEALINTCSLPCMHSTNSISSINDELSRNDIQEILTKNMKLWEGPL